MSAAPAVPQPDLSYTAYGLLAHPHEPHILLLPGAAGWALPTVHPEKRHLISIGPIQQAFCAALGLEVTVLRCVDRVGDPEGDAPCAATFVLESYDATGLPPPGSRWVGQGDLADLPLAQPEQRPIIGTWLAEDATGDIPAQRAPWAQRGWWAAATAWMTDQLARQGLPLSGPIEQVKSWGISALLQAATPAGRVYMKAVPPLFAAEPGITQALAARYPDHVPTPLAVDRERAWMLLADFGEERLEGGTRAQRVEAVRLLARMHRAYVGEEAALLTTGCQDRRLDRLAALIDPLLDDPVALAELEPGEIARLRALAPRLKALCGELAGYAVPQTLGHGDFHGGNVALCEGRLIIFDWTNASLAHPFFDLVLLLRDPDAPAVEADARRHLLDVYLEAWRDYESPERLRAAWAIAEVLGILQQIISYQQIDAALEPTARWYLYGTDWQRLLLKLLDPPDAGLG